MCENHNQFVHLHCHSEYSLLDGLSRVNDLVARAAELDQPAIALTDHGAMYGTMPFYRAAKAAGVKPIIGVETYLAQRTMADKDPQLDKTRFHMLLLAENQTGYLNLLQIASASQLDGYYYKPRIDRAFMASHKDGLIATTGCMAAEIPRALGDRNPKLAQKLMGEYLDIFGKDRLFIELQEHTIPELTEINKQLIEMAPHFGLENNFLATNDVHYTLASDADPHEVLLCIQTGSTVNAPKLTFSDKEYYVKSRDEMFQLFKRNGYKEEHILNSLMNSLRIVEMCNVSLDSKGYHLPEFDVPAGHDPHSYLHELCEKGLVWRYGADRAENDAELRARMKHELNIISRMGFETYFLIVWDLCEWAARTDEWWEQHKDPFPYDDYSQWKENDIWWNVRGSGAGSVVAYTLGITSIDPLVNGLIFERFLNPGRVSMPDIDLDYPDDVRHWMVAYSKRRYGSEKVAQIITFGTLGARAAIRDVGRAMDMPLEEVDVIARMVPAIPGKPVKIENVLDKEHEFYSNELEQKYKGETAVRDLLDTARNLEGVARHASSHAAGVIISDRPLHEYVPLNKPTSGDEGLGGVDRVTQWPMEIVESIGLLKVDFLGLSTLTVMRQAARLIEDRYGIAYTMDNIPYDEGHVGPDPTKNPEVLFDMLGRGDVAGVFQVEGAGMRRLMMEMKPRRFDHIIAAISLYRPGPMENIPEYIRRMHSAIYDNKDVVEYHTPALEPILKDTYGILVYQEQIIRIASDLAGYEPGEADMIRKAVSKKKRDLMDKHRSQFTDGAMARGLSREVCEAIWGDIEFFARYGFNKAHAADYAKVTCQTAFLKAHYPVEYLTAMLSVERDNTEKVRRYFAEAKNLGIDVGPPEINRSGLDFTIEDDGERPLIRFGLGAIKNAGAAALMTIIEEREANGPFKSLQELCKRVDLKRVGKRPLEYMTKGRVFDAWGTPVQFMDALDRIVNFSSSEHAAASTGQMSLFGGASSAPAIKVAVDLLHDPKQIKPAVKHKELLEWEKEALGVHVSEHPLERPLSMLQPRTNATIGDIDANWNGKQVRLAGMISTLRTLTTKKGDPMAFATLEDLEGKMDLVLFPRTWQACRDNVAVDQVMLVTGKVQVKGEDINLIVDRVETNLEIAQDADATRRQAAPAPKPVVAEPAPVMKTAVPPKANGNGNGNGNGHSHISPPPPPTFVAEPKPVFQQAATPEVEVAGGNFVPPPPPNFDDDSEARPITSPAPAAPPVMSNGNGAIAEAPTNKPLVSPAPTRPSNGVHKTVIVEVRPVGNWQEACRRALRKVNEYEGDDGLTIVISGQKLKMDFPNGRTRSCPELLETLRTIPGIAKVHSK
ncbi:MAG: DNA polymerase III subunit alpha [Ardenticatenaceae bacterium]|nr:DNA polymerase III subunit alpha [Ardenticatenaceae bacterium]